MDEIKRSIEDIPTTKLPQDPVKQFFHRRKTRRRAYGAALGPAHKELGRNVRGMRTELGLTVQQLARALAWPVALVTALEEGKVTLSAGQHSDLEKWAAVTAK